MKKYSTVIINESSKKNTFIYVELNVCMNKYECIAMNSNHSSFVSLLIVSNANCYYSRTALTVGLSITKWSVAGSGRNNNNNIIIIIIIIIIILISTCLIYFGPD